MTERPDPFAAVDRYFAAATIAHEYIADLHRELGALGADSAHTRALLGESAAVVTERMPALTRELRQLREQWEAQNLLDPPRAKRTLQLARDSPHRSRARAIGAASAPEGDRRGDARAARASARKLALSERPVPSGRGVLIMPGQRQARVADALDIALLRLGAQLTGSSLQLLRALRAVAQPVLHRGEQPTILIVQRRPRRSRHTVIVPARRRSSCGRDGEVHGRRAATSTRRSADLALSGCDARLHGVDRQNERPNSDEGNATVAPRCRRRRFV